MMNQIQLQKCEKIRVKGKSTFILKTGGVILGLIGFGIIGQIFLIVGEFISNNNSFSFFDKNFLHGLIIRFMSSFPTGCAMGWVIWKINERNYLKAKAE